MTTDIEKEILEQEQEEDEFEGTVLENPNYIEVVGKELGFKDYQVKVVLDFIIEGATVPFIARYKKDQTGNLDEDHIRDIIDVKNKAEKLYKAKQTAVNGIEAMDKMTPELMENILKAKTLKEVEEIYKPYKSKKKTKAMIAIEKGFQVVANYIKTNPASLLIGEIEGVPDLLANYTEEEILEGCVHIISAEISANSDLRADLLETLQKYSNIISKVKGEKSLEKLNDKDKGQVSKFEIYSDFNHRIAWLKPYQILALNRGEKLKILGVKIEKSEKTYEGLTFHYAKILGVRAPFIDILEQAFKDGYDTLFKSVENELRGILSEIGEDDAIETFKQNLAQLLMTKPEYGKKILAIDPGFNAGCKMAILDEGSNPISFDKIFLHKKNEAISKLKNIIKKENLGAIIVGNGTGVNEVTELLHDIVGNENIHSLQENIYIVNESGASVYSASKIAKEEFPDLDSLDKGTISIGRRFIDPLSELVKVPVGSIGVGMYQHDMPEKKLEEKLGNVVEDVVNEIGINVNNASSYVLNHISGIDKRTAKKIYNHRPYKSRVHLKKQLSDKIYEQAAGFLRVPESPEKFDNTDIHPEQYELAKYLIENNIKSSDFESSKIKLQELYSEVGKSIIDFIWESYENIGIEKRVNSTHKKSIKKGSVKIEVGSIVEGVIRNVVAFGAFVDIGMKNDGLVHVSQIADKFVSDPKEEVEVGQTVKVKVTGIDEKTGKIQLSMKEVN